MSKQIKKSIPKRTPIEVNIADLETAPWNPRGELTKESVQDLVPSIQSKGLIQRIAIVRDSKPVVMRIDGTQLSVMRFYGGGIFNGAQYTTFEDKTVAGELTSEYATIAVRQDFLKWVTAKIREENRKACEVK